jgi:hypothetical protein
MTARNITIEINSISTLLDKKIIKGDVESIERFQTALQLKQLQFITLFIIKKY